MESKNELIEIIRSNNNQINRINIKRILILFEFPKFIIGDSIIRMRDTRLLTHIYCNASIDINFEDVRYKYLIKNNPFFNQITFLNWESINYSEYDLILVSSYKELDFINFIQNSSNQLDIQKLHVLYIFPNFDNNPISPVFKCPPQLTDVFIPNDVLSKCLSNEIYISSDEQHLADIWLKDQGLKSGEKLVILLDSTSVSSKLLSKAVHFQLVEYFSRKENTKILIFDEDNKNKKNQYRMFLKPETMQKLIFAEGINLRDSLCLIGSSSLKMIFGPCTGLLHCASGIYNNYRNNGLAENDLPIMISYTGRYVAENTNAYDWWKDSMADCLILTKNQESQPSVVNLDEIPSIDLITHDNLLLCKSYTFELLISYINEKYEQKLKLFGLE